MYELFDYRRSYENYTSGCLKTSLLVPEMLVLFVCKEKLDNNKVAAIAYEDDLLALLGPSQSSQLDCENPEVRNRKGL